MKTILLLLAFTIVSTKAQNVILYKIASPADEKTNGKFVTLLNISPDTAYLDQENYYLVRETNGSGTFGNKKLTGKIAPKSTFVIAGRAAFEEVYLKPADCVAGCVTGNGNDAYFLYKNGDQTSGQLVDIFGQINTDGLNQNWDYTDAIAVRKNTNTTATTTCNIFEWDIFKNALSDTINPWSINTSTNLKSIIANNSEINIYPNPFNDFVQINSEITNITQFEVISMNGISVYKSQSINNLQLSVDLSFLKQGVYIIRPSLENGSTYSYVVIKTK